jgi:hypothetical protein
MARRNERAEAATPGPLRPLPRLPHGSARLWLGRGGGGITFRRYDFGTVISSFDHVVCSRFSSARQWSIMGAAQARHSLN